MSTEDHVEIISGQPMITFESDFVDYQERQELCPTRDVSGDLSQPTVEETIRQVAAALELLDLCDGDPCTARIAIERAIGIREGALTDFSAAVGAASQDATSADGADAPNP